MRRIKTRFRRHDRNRVPRAVRELRITEEEILGDLLYPASPSWVGVRRRKDGR